MLLSILFTLSVAQAQEDIEDIKVFVKGMVCSFCVQGVEKQFKSQDSVEQVIVDLHDSSVSLWLKEHQTLSDEIITDLIKDSGYNIESIERLSTPKDPLKDNPSQTPSNTQLKTDTKSSKE